MHKSMQEAIADTVEAAVELSSAEARREEQRHITAEARSKAVLKQMLEDMQARDRYVA